MTATELLLKQENQYLRDRLRAYDQYEQSMIRGLAGRFAGDIDLSTLTFPSALSLPPLIRVELRKEGFRQLVIATVPSGIGYYGDLGQWKELSLYDKAQFIDQTLDYAKHELLNGLIKSTGPQALAFVT